MANEEWEKVSWEEKIEAKCATKPSTALEGDYVNISQMWNRDIYTFEPAPVRPLPEELELMRIRREKEEERRLVAEKEEQARLEAGGDDGDKGGGQERAKALGARKMDPEDKGLGRKGLGRGRPQWDEEGEELPFVVAVGGGEEGKEELRGPDAMHMLESANMTRKHFPYGNRGWRVELPHAILMARECAADTSGDGLWGTDVAVATGRRGDEHGTVDAEEDTGTSGAGLDVGDGERVVGRCEDRVGGHVEGVLGVGGADECDRDAGLAG
ncbi:hypothetical protein LTR96_000946 [Exophiala xenobiotica]|nr:hypothetical protein LTR92_003185 [Exophiala xenobiotica]KAK5274345.1 hypothetical protein LTR96_000946 [Exophiala xenobiotica]KAK5343673.1 hypothetical protein LTR98_001303 [Exophiala xenobiotica]KAK5559314.1 hypothetical protein LTR46_002356 [Exophiala xenobiotica]